VSWACWELVWLPASFPPPPSPPFPPSNPPSHQPTNQQTNPNQPIHPSTPPPTLTPPPTAVPQPTAPYSPTLADWTILVYMAADNDLSAAAWRDLNEMEAAGSHTAVNLLVQLDDAADNGARRYRIEGDGDATAVTTPPLAQLPETNTGDPQTLADFLAWGVSEYPANRYALILWDHGAGWQGLAFDNDTADYALPDHLSLPDLSGALAQANLPRFDLIAFDACLMAQLDVLTAVAPFARYAVAAADLTPGGGWDYQSWLRQLYARPDVDGAALARLLVDDFAATYTQSEPDDFVTMAAISLDDLPALTYAVESLAQRLLADPAFVAGAVGDARLGAEAFARVYPAEFEQYAAIDLGHFARILAQRSPDPAITAAAEAVDGALQTAVFHTHRGLGFKHSAGLALYFPRTAEFYAPDYPGVTALRLWPQFLTAYHAAGQTIPPPAIHLASATADSVGLQSPAYLDFQIVGRNVADVVFLAAQVDENGRRRLLEYDPLIPEPTYLPDGSVLGVWRDGVHDDFFIWDTEVTYLYDAAGSGDFVVMWPTAPDSSRFVVRGQYWPADGTIFPANLVFDHRTGALARVWGLRDGGAPAEIVPQPGDVFTPLAFFLDDNNAITPEPGAPLTFDETGRLYYDWRALPDGRYAAGLQVENGAGETAVAFTDLTIGNSALLPGQVAYLDPYLGFQFLYPESWHTPRYTDTLLYTSDLTGTTQLQITLYPRLETAVINPTTLKNQTLSRFGPVDVLFEEEVQVAGLGGQRVAYGYQRAGEGPRTGLFFTFVRNGVGYVVDVDGPQTAEAQTITAVQTLLETWRFTGQGVGLPPGAWAQLNLADFTVAHPADFAYQPQGDWQRFVADGRTFIALRAQPATRPAADVLAALLRDASAGIQGFTAGDPYAFPLAGLVWSRADVAYTAADGTPVTGFIMVRLAGEREIVAWAEGRTAVFPQLEATTFLTLIADLRLE
jgi:hypothetical protein